MANSELAGAASQKVRDGLKEILLGPGQLYEALRAEVNVNEEEQNDVG